jgi:hypothetical protein
MPASATEGTILAKLIALAGPLCRAAQRALPRRGRGAPPEYPDWKIAVLITVAVTARRKSKSAQYRFLNERRVWLVDLLGLRRFPSRSTYFDRYLRAAPLFEEAVERQGRAAIEEGLVDPTVVAADKSLVRARGAPWPQAARREGRVPRGTDTQATWGYSEHHGWVYGYSYEVVVSATAASVVFPLLVSVGVASCSENRSVAQKIPRLPRRAMYVVADAGYDSNASGEAIEYGPQGNPTGRHFVCPLQARGGNPPVGHYPHRGRRERLRRRRAKRLAFFRSRQGRQIYRRRGMTVEPFNEWFKNKFDLHGSVWHRGLANNRTQLAAAMFVYQLLVRHHHRTGGDGASIQWILDAL